MLINERFKSPNKEFEKVYAIFDKRDYFNNKGLAKTQIGNFKRALEKNDIPFDPSLIYTCENVTFEEGLIFGKKILEDHPDVDGIFVITDLVAVGVLTHFNEKKINSPSSTKA